RRTPTAYGGVKHYPIGRPGAFVIGKVFVQPVKEIITTIKIVERVIVEVVFFAIGGIGGIGNKRRLIGGIVVLGNVPAQARDIFPYARSPLFSCTIIGFVPH